VLEGLLESLTDSHELGVRGLWKFHLASYHWCLSDSTAYAVTHCCRVQAQPKRNQKSLPGPCGAGKPLNGERLMMERRVITTDGDERNGGSRRRRNGRGSRTGLPTSR
jgi:hypothetical protein